MDWHFRFILGTRTSGNGMRTRMDVVRHGVPGTMKYELVDEDGIFRRGFWNLLRFGCLNMIASFSLAGVSPRFVRIRQDNVIATLVGTSSSFMSQLTSVSEISTSLPHH